MWSTRLKLELTIDKKKIYRINWKTVEEVLW